MCLLLYLICFFTGGADAVKNGLVSLYIVADATLEVTVDMLAVRGRMVVTEASASHTAYVMVRCHITVKAVGRIGDRNTPYLAKLGKAVEIAVNRTEAYARIFGTDHMIYLLGSRVRTGRMHRRKYEQLLFGISFFNHPNLLTVIITNKMISYGKGFVNRKLIYFFTFLRKDDRMRTEAFYTVFTYCHTDIQGDRYAVFADNKRRDRLHP